MPVTFSRESAQRIIRATQTVERWTGEAPKAKGPRSGGGNGPVGICWLASRWIDIGSPPAGTTCVKYDVQNETVTYDSDPEPIAGAAQNPDFPRLPLRYVRWPLVLMRAG